MMDFFVTMMIITGGVISIGFWLVLLVGLLIEINDTLNPKSKQGPVIEQEDYS